LPGASRAVLIDSSDWSTKRGGGGRRKCARAEWLAQGWRGGGGERGEGGEQVQHGIEKILAPARTC
jgi:hypothetical protein